MPEQLDGLKSGAAQFSPDRVYRYKLTRRWGENFRDVLWVMLNPSIADGDTPDPTITKCVEFSRRWGMDSLTVVNLYALVSTNPDGLWAHEDPVGRENDAVIALAAQDARMVVVAWGANAPHPDRARTVTGILRSNGFSAQENGRGGRVGIVQCLGRTKDGHPKHPGRLAYATPLEVFYG